MKQRVDLNKHRAAKLRTVRKVNKILEREAKPTMPFEFADRSIQAFYHACEKHPYFADVVDNVTTEGRADILRIHGEIFASYLKHECVDFETVLRKQVTNMLLNAGMGHKDAAIHYAYNTIAVLMRIISVLEGTQKLGKVGGEGAAETGKGVR